MKKPQSPKAKPKHLKKVIEPDASLVETSLNEDKLAEDHFAVTGHVDEASSTGHRVEPIINDEEGNAERLIEEGLHGYMHRSKKAR